MEKEIIKAINAWLGASRFNTMARLATELGYSSSNTIYQWLRKGNVPLNKWNEIKRILEKGDKKNESKNKDRSKGV